MLTRSAIPTRRLATAAVAGVSAVALLAGCGMTTKQQAAAVVNGSVIHQDEVEVAAHQLSQLGFNEQGVVLALIASPMLIKQVDTSGSWKPDATYATLLARIPDATQATKDTLAAAALLESGAMTPADVAGYRKALDAAHISLNPKYGEVKKSNTGPLYFTLGAATPNWIAAPSK